jgi:NADPH-dependent curcumin reductase CurA
VGGEMLDTALNLMNTFGRIIACGGISQYNAKDDSEIYGLKNYMAIVRSQLLYQGFIVTRWADEFDEARAQL